VGCFALIAGLGYYVVGPQLVAQSHWRDGQAAMNDADFIAAREHLRHCVDAWPSSAETHFTMARACRRAGDFDTAQKHLKRAEQLGWLESQVGLENVLAAVQQGDFGLGAEETLKAYLAAGMHPDEPLLYEAMAKGYLHSYRLFDARAILEDWARAYPDHWQAHLWHGTVLERLGKAELEKARADYERVLTLRPQYHEAHLRLGRVLLSGGGDYVRATQHFMQYLEKERTNGEALLGFARCQRALNATGQARGALERLLNTHPEYVAGLVEMARLELDADRVEAALRHLQLAEKVGPNEMSVMHHMGLVQRRLGQVESAERYERRFRELEGLLRELDGATRRAATNPRDAEPRQQAGAIMLKVGQEIEGLRWLDAALRLDARHKPTHRTLAEYHEQSKDPERQRLAATHRKLAE
jgi:tetratricopeptide (TPR) repeat protein